MLTHTLVGLMALGGGAAIDAGSGLVRPGAAPDAVAVEGPAEVDPEVRYAPEAREVTNWRRETAADLEPAPLAALAALTKADRPFVTRCVRLNNYWCVKSARWNGEIGADEEGHVGFASAERGADAAATLLRRYYLEFGRKSALAIVRRWAPAECNVLPGGSTPGMGVLALRGIGATLRARYLAARRRVRTVRPAAKPVANVRTTAAVAEAAAPVAPSARAAPASTGRDAPASAVRRAVFPPRTTGPAAQDSAPMRSQAPSRPAAAAGPPAARTGAATPRAASAFRVPDIAAGLGERPPATLSRSLPYRAAPPRPAPKAAAVKPPSPTALAPAPPRPAEAAAPAATLACAPDEQRLLNYAGRIVEGLGLGPEDDLRLFEPDGTPTPNLAPVLLAMSSFELGMLRASAELVAGAVARQALRAKVLQETDEPAPPPPEAP